MDFFSLFWSLLGFGTGRSDRANNLRLEAVKLNAEVAGEAGRAYDLLVAARGPLLRRIARHFPDHPELADQCNAAFDSQIRMLTKIIEIAQDNSNKFENASPFADWNAVVRKGVEWRATATRFVPSAEDLVRRMEHAVDQDIRQINGSR